MTKAAVWRMSPLAGACVWAVLFAVLIWPHATLAHPHAFIDVRTTVIFGAPGKIIALREEWSFDKDYTAFLAPESAQWKTLSNFTRTSLKNLEPYNYFMEFHAGALHPTMGEASDAVSEIKNGRLTMRFTVPLKSPLDLPPTGMTYSIYDPTYYIEITYLKDRPVSFEGPGASGCAVKIQEPKPPDRVRSLAQSMDRLAEPNRELGKQFAETVQITC